MPNQPDSHLKLVLDGKALVSNWQALNDLSGTAACGAAVKADGYGLGGHEVVSRLLRAGCRDFFVATWAEAAEVEWLLNSASLTVLNGLLDGDMDFAARSGAKPMLNSAKQVELWRPTGKPCDIMVETGMNRLGIPADEIDQIDWTGLDVDCLSSHLASADEDALQNANQLAAFNSVGEGIPHKRKSIANSAGIALGTEYHFDLTRPGLSIYGGIPRSELADSIQSVGQIEVPILQVRWLEPGDRAGYNATFVADHLMPIAIISMGYADGYMRGFSGSGCFFHGGNSLPVIGRVSMDLVAIDLTAARGLTEGDTVTLPLDLPELSRQSAMSQYEMLTALGSRFDRKWMD